MSHFLYLHQDLTGTPDVWKIGVAITPYSANRLRQRLCWEQVGLDHLWFGVPSHIQYLEDRVKSVYQYQSGAVINGYGVQTELINTDITSLKSVIAETIEQNKLCVIEMPLDKKYTAVNSKQCPYKIPSEKFAGEWLNNKVRQHWPEHCVGNGFVCRYPDKKSVDVTERFSALFDIDQ